VRPRLLAAALLVVIGCSNSPQPPAPPSVDGSTPITVNPTDKLGWDQQAADFSELSTIGYEMYIDGTPSRLDGVTCDNTPSSAGFACKAPLPGMPAGAHRLELASFYLSNPDAKSARAGPLNITVRSIVSGDPVSSRSTAPSSKNTARAEPWPAGSRLLTRGLDGAADLAFTPDQRMFIAERGGRIRVFRDGQLLDDPALALPVRRTGEGAIVSLAIDPAFARNGFVYAIYTTRSRAGALSFALARFREARDTLADGIVILGDIRASIDARAVVRFGIDGKLYAAFDDGGDDRSAGDLASLNGKLLRLNPDGTTPDDAPGKSPVLLEGISSPRGMAWHEATRHLWLATATHVDAIRWPSTPNALAGAGNDLFIGSDTGLVRVKLGGRAPALVARTDDLVSGLPVRAVAVRPDGEVFFATDDALGLVEQ
jgi:hypothetical protein